MHTESDDGFLESAKFITAFVDHLIFNNQKNLSINQ